MSAIGGWLGSGAGVVVIGLCVVMSIYMIRLPAKTHPWIHRALIVGMFCGGAALAVTQIGSWTFDAIYWVAGLIGGTSYGIGYITVVLLAVFFFAVVVSGLIWTPDITVAYTAAALPLLLALPPGGFLHHLYLITTYPAQQLTEAIAHAVGG